MESDVSEIMAVITVCLRNFARLEYAGYLTRIGLASLQEQFFGILQQAKIAIEETKSLDEDVIATNEVADEHVQMLLKNGAVQASTPEEATKLIDAKEADQKRKEEEARQKVRQPWDKELPKVQKAIEKQVKITLENDGTTLMNNKPFETGS